MISPALTRANPLALLGVGLLAIVGSLGVRSVMSGLVTVAVIGVLALAFVPGLVTSAWRVVGPVAGAVSVGLSTWLVAGHDAATAATAALRILVLALPGVVVAPLIDPARLGDYLAQRLHLPARPVAAVAATVQRFDGLTAVWAQLDRARRARGLGPARGALSRLRHVGALTFGLLVAALRGSARMAVAMDARGFAAATRRTWAEPAPWRLVDTAVSAVAVGLAVLPYAVSATT